MLLALGGAITTAACSDDGPRALPLSTSGSGGSDSSGSSNAAGGGISANIGEELFRELEEDFVSECASCHKIGGSADTPFLGDPEGKTPDPYEAVTTWPSAIVSEAGNSVLLTWPAQTVHSGGPISDELAAKLLTWLEEEAKAVAAVDTKTVPTIPPFKPILGFNAVYLDALGDEFAGMAVTFTADELTDTALNLMNLQVHPTTKNGLKLRHPLFNVFAVGSSTPDPDPIDSFSNVEISIDAGDSAPLGPGTVVLSNWVSGGKLSLAFELLELIPANDPGAGGGGGGPEGPCSALDAFIDNAQPEFQNNCFGCHGGNNGSATNAVDMSDLIDDPSAACGQILNRVDVNNADNSQIFVTTDPSGTASHPYKFGGMQNQFDNFQTAVSTWITAESP